MSTSQLMQALWSDEERPVTARKILQNAVCGLRVVLAATPDAAEEPVSLLTRAPGYMLKVPPDRVDLHIFRQKVMAGRAALAAGSHRHAADSLRSALALWRGAVLADLVETGVLWPELAAMESTRLDVLEDYFEAELACGRHSAVLGQLETMVETEPLRERFCGQLMLALYRCGRQADALGVYARARGALVELGLEPGRDLQLLQRSILNHDATLHLSGVTAPTAPRPAARLLPERRAPATAGTGPHRAEPAERPADAPAEEHRIPGRTTAEAERRDVSAVLLRTQLGPGSDAFSAEDLDELIEAMSAVFREQIERFGGTVAASIGSHCLGLFGVDRDGAGAAVAAVRATLAIREALTPPAGLADGRAAARHAPTLHAAVVTGKALLRRAPGDRAATPSVNGALLDTGRRLLSDVPAGAIHVCDRTHRATTGFVSYQRTEGAVADWRVSGLQPVPRTAAPVGQQPPRLVNHELQLLGSLLERTTHQRTAHLVTVLGDSQIGTTRFLQEFQHLVTREQAQAPEDRRRDVRLLPVEDVSRTQATVLAHYCAIQPGDAPHTARDKLTAALDALATSPAEAAWLTSRLGPLLVPAWDVPVDQTADAWRRFLHLAALERPLVLTVTGLHTADDALLDLIENLTESSAGIPLLVVAGAGPHLLRRRPEWAGGRSHTTITLDPLWGTAADRLLETFLLTGPVGARRAADRDALVLRALTAEREEEPEACSA
ncbi:BTAD domain-containing putative transcriptional regulator [Streptomyces marincola]|uniref:BTAD domain-containing putative transcriptional regulator n=1 Tax=Streptomyces marincola TaxID=2878388 RepID=UPI0021002385|nr:BTAD domain-containing putative transcriptional regulator [Streptomyces marincola]